MTAVVACFYISDFAPAYQKAMKYLELMFPTTSNKTITKELWGCEEETLEGEGWVFRGPPQQWD